MNTLELLQINLHVAHDSFARTAADLTQEMCDWLPPGEAHPIGERYAHTVAAEDWLVNGMSRGQAPWFSSSWKGKTGFDQINLGATSAEAKAMRVVLPQLHEYARAVFADTEAYLKSLDEREIQRVYDMSSVGYGRVPAPVWWSSFIIGHLHDVMGEISCLKGCQGFKGYPF